MSVYFAMSEPVVGLSWLQVMKNIQHLVTLEEDDV
jgi:hypothetical protein